MIVLDTSAAVSCSLSLPGWEAAKKFIEDADLVVAPDFFVSEVSNVLWKYHQFQKLALPVCEKALEVTVQFIDEFYESKLFYHEAFSLACYLRTSAYDMFFLVLARRNNALLLTLDRDLKTRAKKQGIKVGP